MEPVAKQEVETKPMAVKSKKKDIEAIRLGRLIAFIRGIKGMSQLELAKEMETSANTVWRWENGTQSPTYLTIAKMAKTMRISVQMFSFSTNSTDLNEEK